jgi:hypothetical protein
MSAESGQLPQLLGALNRAHSIAKGMADGTIAATSAERNFAESMQDDIAIQIRKTKQEMMRK